MIAVNLTAEQAQAGDPGLAAFAIPHDDFPRGTPLARMTPFANRTVVGVRGMSERSDIYKDIPDGLYYTYANEDDDPDRSWRLAYARQVKAERPGLKLVCPPEKWFERNQYDTDEVAACDYVGIHIGIPEFLDASGTQLVPDGTIVNYPISLNGKPTVCLEVESDPAHPEQMALIPEVTRRLVAAGMPLACPWGGNMQYPDILDHPDIMSELRALAARTIPISEPIGTQGGTTVAVDPTIQQVLDQNALIADALYDLTQALTQVNPDAPAGGYADLLQDAKTKVNALNPSKFVFR